MSSSSFDSKLEHIFSLLKEAQVDDDTLTAAVLRNANFEAEVRADRIKKIFGESVNKLYLGTLPLDNFAHSLLSGQLKSNSSKGKVDLSRILVAMVDDVRVILIHFAELLVKMRNAQELSASELENLATQVLDVFAPLANKLGIWRFKWELEDLSFKHLNRTEFNRIARFLDERRAERETYIDQFVALLQDLMNKLHIQATVYGRAKHLYGIWKKLNNNGISLNDLFDVLAVRILVDDTASCYEALGAVHATWTSINQEFDDYIANPKPNGYRSLHTAVYGPNSKIVEVQIRTVAMHKDCEFGVAAHWRYKENSKAPNYQDEKVTLLRQLMAWKDEISGVLEDKYSNPAQVSNTHIYVFTPIGNVIELPAGATPIDFAYAIHTHVGHKCKGAKVNNRMVPLTYTLETGDWVEIRTGSKKGPSRDWLNPNQNFTVTAKAQSCIRRWFKQQEYGRYLTQGKALLEKELERNHITKVNMDKLAISNGYKSSSDLFVAIGMKELKVYHSISDLLDSADNEKQVDEIPLKHSRASDIPLPTLSIQGDANYLTNHASCCSPLPGDSVIGYITVARGITIHKVGCKNIEQMLQNHPERKISVQWETKKNMHYAIDLALEAEGHSKLLQEVANVVESLKFRLTAVNSGHMKLGEVNKVYVTVEIKSIDDLQKLINRLRQIERVFKVYRLS